MVQMVFIFVGINKILVKLPFYEIFIVPEQSTGALQSGIPVAMQCFQSEAEEITMTTS